MIVYLSFIDDSTDPIYEEEEYYEEEEENFNHCTTQGKLTLASFIPMQAITNCKIELCKLTLANFITYARCIRHALVTQL